MRAVLCCLVLMLATVAAQAQTPRIDRVEVTAKGIFETEGGKRANERGSATGSYVEVTNPKLVSAMTRTNVAQNLEIGIQFTVHGSPKGTPVQLRIVHIFPTQGLRNPETSLTFYREEYFNTVVIGEPSYQGYKLEREWEVVPGTWVLQIWHEDRKLADQSFTLAKVGADPAETKSRKRPRRRRDL